MAFITTGIIALAGLALAIGGPTTAESSETRHSGRIVALDAGRLTIEEIGPWQGPAMGARILEAIVGPETRIVGVHRVEGVEPGGWPGAYGSVALPLRALRVGDFVTVVLDERDPRAAAVAVEVMRAGAAAARCAPDELLVGFVDDPAEGAAALYAQWGASVIDALPAIQVHRIRVAPRVRARAALALARLAEVEFVERNCGHGPAGSTAVAGAVTFPPILP